MKCDVVVADVAALFRCNESGFLHKTDYRFSATDLVLILRMKAYGNGRDKSSRRRNDETRNLFS